MLPCLESVFSYWFMLPMVRENSGDFLQSHTPDACDRIEL